MIRVNVHDAKTNLSRYLSRVLEGETVVICNRNVPVAELRPIPQPLAGRRPTGLAKGLVKVANGAFDPLTEDQLQDWESGDL